MKARFVEDVTLTLQFAAAALAVVAATLAAAARGFLLLLLRRAEAGTGRAEEIPHEDPVEEDRVHGDDGGQAYGARSEEQDRHSITVHRDPTSHPAQQQYSGRENKEVFFKDDMKYSSQPGLVTAYRRLDSPHVGLSTSSCVNSFFTI